MGKLCLYANVVLACGYIFDIFIFLIKLMCLCKGEIQFEYVYWNSIKFVSSIKELTV